jgi:hypothetical protein
MQVSGPVVSARELLQQERYPPLRHFTAGAILFPNPLTPPPLALSPAFPPLTSLDLSLPRPRWGLGESVLVAILRRSEGVLRSDLTYNDGGFCVYRLWVHITRALGARVSCTSLDLSPPRPRWGLGESVLVAILRRCEGVLR